MDIHRRHRGGAQLCFNFASGWHALFTRSVVLQVQFRRPPVNAMSVQVLKEIQAAFESLSSHKDVKAVLLTAETPKSDAVATRLLRTLVLTWELLRCGGVQGIQRRLGPEGERKVYEEGCVGRLHQVSKWAAGAVLLALLVCFF